MNSLSFCFGILMVTKWKIYEMKYNDDYKSQRRIQMRGHIYDVDVVLALGTGLYSGRMGLVIRAWNQ